MRFRISHETVYEYATPAFESVGELRIFPVDTPAQAVLKRDVQLEPAASIETFEDCFGNTAGFFTIPFRHRRLRVRMSAEVETCPPPPPGAAADMPVGQVKRLNRDRRIDLYLFRQPTIAVPLGSVVAPLRKRFFRESTPLGEALHDLNGWIHGQFSYKPGLTDVGTPLSEVIRHKAGVCQDFAHLMLAILRSNGLVARYVSGYIEPFDPTRKNSPELIGAAASHAWVEVHLPNGTWWGFDPTNNQCVGERHVRVAVGRDYNDVSPLRGTCKGALNQTLKVIVSMKRRSPLRRPS